MSDNWENLGCAPGDAPQGQDIAAKLAKDTEVKPEAKPEPKPKPKKENE